MWNASTGAAGLQQRWQRRQLTAAASSNEAHQRCLVVDPEQAKGMVVFLFFSCRRHLQPSVSASIVRSWAEMTGLADLFLPCLAPIPQRGGVGGERSKPKHTTRPWSSRSPQRRLCNRPSSCSRARPLICTPLLRRGGGGRHVGGRATGQTSCHPDADGERRQARDAVSLE